MCEQTGESGHIRFTRPGGLDLTERALALCRLAEGSRVLDVGCGSGESVAHMCARHRLDAVGLDISAEVLTDAAVGAAGRLMLGDAQALPFADDEFDCVLFECSLSKVADAARALAEAARVLRPGGWTAVSDFFAEAVERQYTGVLGRVPTLETWSKRFHNAGFDILYEEERVADLRKLWGQLVFDYGLERILSDPHFDMRVLRTETLGYFLTVSRKRVEV